MYRCEICGACSKPKQPRRVHVIEREVAKSVAAHRGPGQPPYANQGNTRKEIAREVSVCEEHYQMLSRGLYTLSELAAMHRYLPRSRQPVKTADELFNSHVEFGDPVG